MTERLTKEREKGIRDWGLSETVRSVNPHLAEVIAELDAVRQERDALTAQCASLQQDNIALKSRLCNHCYREVDDPTAAKSQVETLTLQLETARKALQTIRAFSPGGIPIATVSYYRCPEIAKQALADMKVE